VREANAAGLRLLEREPEDVRAGLLHPEGRSPAGRSFRLTPLQGQGPGGDRLAVLHAPVQDAQARLGAAAHQWGLTPRQTEVVALLARGQSNKEIAHALGCSSSTVEVHLTAVLRKAGVKSRAELVARYFRLLEG
jgi:DNA-binding CsgD family transcriptional regulator